jgi:putative NADH-flavin reductase
MNVLVIGAAGKTGKLVVESAIAAGHAMTAFVHDPSTYSAPPGVKVVAGDATDAKVVSDACEGQDAVIDAVGGKTPYKHTELERSVASAVIDGMTAHGVRRLIVISALGVGDSLEQTGFFYEHLLLPTFLRGSTADKEAMEARVRASGLEFVIVRPAVLNDHDAAGEVKVFEGDEKAHKITRADTARFCVEQLASDLHLGQAVTIANA